MYFQERAACASIRLVIRSIGSAISTVLCTCARTGGGESNWRKQCSYGEGAGQGREHEELAA